MRSAPIGGPWTGVAVEGRDVAPGDVVVAVSAEVAVEDSEATVGDKDRIWEVVVAEAAAVVPTVATCRSVRVTGSAPRAATRTLRGATSAIGARRPRLAAEEEEAVVVAVEVVEDMAATVVEIEVDTVEDEVDEAVDVVAAVDMAEIAIQDQCVEGE